jgi:hypothetical protein
MRRPSTDEHPSRSRRSEAILPVHAAARRRVIWQGRTATLVFVARFGERAKVELAPGRFVTARCADLVLLPEVA